MAYETQMLVLASRYTLPKVIQIHVNLIITR